MSSLDDVDDYDPNYKPDTTDSKSNTTTDTSTTVPATTNDVLDEFFSELSTEEKNYHINRILKCIRIDPYAILDIPLSQFDSDTYVQKQYKYYSLIVHPDKNPDNRQNAQNAFSLLGKAKNDILDTDKHSFYLSLLDTAHSNIKQNHKGIDFKSQKYIDLVRAEFTEQLILDEWRQRQLKALERNLTVREHNTKQQAEQQVKQKEDEKHQWTAGTEKRINNWRQFQKSGAVKKVKVG